MANFQNAIVACFVLTLSFTIQAIEDNTTADLADGLNIYRHGILPSGKKLTAIVADDIAVSGKQFSCTNCHGRSGMGTIEGNYIVPPIAGFLLFSDSNQPVRSAYNEVSLARLLRTGINSDGKTVDKLMPRFVLTDSEISELTKYLKNLSSKESPGIDSQVIRLATVVTDDVSPELVQSVHQVLQSYIEEKNRQTRLESRRPNRGKKPELRSASLFRKWSLDVWRLKGPQSSWKTQLENYYLKQPVFALLGGLSTKSWRPIGNFCETNEIPCMFPSTDFYGGNDQNFYTYHFSQGLELEAKLIADQISDNKASQVVQVSCQGLASEASKILDRELARQEIKTRSLNVDCDNPKIEHLVSQLNQFKTDSAVLWLDRQTLDLLIGKLSFDRIYTSSTLLKQKLNLPVASVEKNIFVAHPYRLPNQYDSALSRFKIWAKLRKIKITNLRYQAEAFFACLAMKDALSHIRRHRVRDYLLDVLDHSQGLELYLPIYPRPTLGPGQRFLTKGGYILPIVAGETDSKNAVWLTP